MAANQSGTFSYAPDIACSIYTTGGILDVSQDIIDLTVTRNIAAVSQVHMDLANPGKKYNRVINTMDRIVVFLKRTEWVQVFTGYVTFAPVETLIPSSVTISADCTLRIMQNTYWDDTLQEYQQLLLNQMDGAASSSDATLNDGGVAQAVINLLTKVCSWDPSRIHIQGMPTGFLSLATRAYKNVVTGTAQNEIYELSKILGSSPYVAGNSTSTGSSDNSTTQKVTGASGSPAGTEFTANYVKSFYTSPLGDGAKANWPGKNSSNPVSLDGINHDRYYASIPFTYASFGPKDSEFIANAKSWISQMWPHGNKNDKDANLRGRLLIVSNSTTNRVVALRATSLVQKPDKLSKHKTAIVDKDIANIDYIQVHPSVAAYLNGDIDDPMKFNTTKDAKPPEMISAYMDWADENGVRTPGPQAAMEAVARAAAKAAGLPGADSLPNTTKTYKSAQQAVIAYAVAQTGANYSQGGAGGVKDVYGGKTRGREVPKSANSPGYFDCSGLTQWAYSKIGVKIGANTTAQWGTGTKSDNKTHGTLIPKNVQPQPGDIMFWNVPADGGMQPAHVTMLSKGFGNDGAGTMMAANSWGHLAGEQPVNWNNIKNGGELPGWGMSYMGARRPLDLTDPSRTYDFPPTTDVPDTSSKSDPNSPESNYLSLTGSYSYLNNAPSFDVRAGMLRGSPRAFLLDNNVMSDFTQIIGAGLRTYMSAPNGDFVAWFPDYWGFYGTDPVLDISPVEIIDFQIYHDDNQLVTHYGIIGDTNGIGQQVSDGDYLSTNGIVSIQDGGVMNILFGKASLGQANSGASSAFLQRYGMRPMAKEQNMIRSHAMEFIYALTGFMNQWVNQYSSTVSLTFMPELYPGMRVTMDIDNDDGTTSNYQFYCTSVTHQCSRSSGFTTQANFTAPKKDGVILDYGLSLI